MAIDFQLYIELLQKEVRECYRKLDARDNVAAPAPRPAAPSAYSKTFGLDQREVDSAMAEETFRAPKNIRSEFPYGEGSYRQ
jgi:hypothetical protein